MLLFSYKVFVSFSVSMKEKWVLSQLSIIQLSSTETRNSICNKKDDKIAIKRNEKQKNSDYFAMLLQF